MAETMIERGQTVFSSEEWGRGWEIKTGETVPTGGSPGCGPSAWMSRWLAPPDFLQRELCF